MKKLEGSAEQGLRRLRLNSRNDSAEKWARCIQAQLGKTVESIIETGRLLVKAKASLKHGEWTRLFDENGLLPFGIRTAQQFMAVAQHSLLSNTKHASHLPASWFSLYQLTQVEPKRLSAAIEDGTITPDMKRADIKALLPQQTKTQRKPTEKKEFFDPEIECFLAVETRIMDIFFDLDRESQDDLIGRLEQLVESLHRHQKKESA